MATPRKPARLFPVALSPTQAAECMGLRRDQIADAIRSGDLPCYRLGVKRRILVESLVAWVKTWEQTK